MSFISTISVSSIALGVMALIIVLSVMNGFQKEVRDRMLSVLSHVEVVHITGSIPDWKALSETILTEKHTVACAPYVAGQGLLNRRGNLRGIALRGIDPTYEPQVSDVAKTLGESTLSALKAGDFGVILGRDLARLLRVNVGDKVTLIVAKGNTTPAGFVPRMKQMTVKGLFQSGHYEFDSTLVFTHIDDAAALFRTGGPTGIRVKLDDINLAPTVTQHLLMKLPADYYATDWTRQNRTWFAAVQVEKRMMAVILFLIVLVGSFGLVSTLVMTVTEKQSDIAILRTLGASPQSIMTIFVIQGCIVGLIGVLLGTGLGLAISCNLDVIVPAIEHLFGVEFLPREIYFISQMPSDPRASDIVPIAVVSFLASLLATLYPSWRAARTHPAQALRHE
jgi:lipoprotein releasing system, transmembrane protein, lolC/E family